MNKETTVYNFKEYYRCHYGDSINNAKKQEEMNKETIKQQKAAEKENKTIKEASYIYISLLTLISVYLTYINL